MLVLTNLMVCICVQLVVFQHDGLSETRSQEMDSIEITSDFLTGHDFADSRLVTGHGPILLPLSGQWQLTWDDTVDGELDPEEKNCTVDFKEVDGSLSGRFVGPVAGSERDAIITGKIHGAGSGRIVNFQQRESGYVCSFQAIDAGGEIVGVWHDTRNRSGDFRLLRHQ